MTIEATRLIVRRDRLLAEARPVGYLLTNSFLSQHSIISKALVMRPTKLLVYLTIVVAAVQKLMRKPDLSSNLHGVLPMPRAMIGYISRRAVAASTSLPRENIRRLIDELLLEDKLITDGRGAVANRGQILSKPEIVAGLQQLVFEIANVAEKLIEAGVIEVREPKVKKSR
jgi:hypothetical protein